MKRVMLELSPELLAAIDAARGRGRKRNPAIEDWLWLVQEIRRAAAALGVRRPERRKAGRPKRETRP